MSRIRSLKSYFPNKVKCDTSIKLESRFVVSPSSRAGGGGPFRKWFGVESTLSLIKARRTLYSVYIHHTHTFFIGKWWAGELSTAQPPSAVCWTSTARDMDSLKDHFFISNSVSRYMQTHQPVLFGVFYIMSESQIWFSTDGETLNCALPVQKQ
jgi:hypothetical protein